MGRGSFASKGPRGEEVEEGEGEVVEEGGEEVVYAAAGKGYYYENKNLSEEDEEVEKLPDKGDGHNLFTKKRSHNSSENEEEKEKGKYEKEEENASMPKSKQAMCSDSDSESEEPPKKKILIRKK